jgi:hypothetical protein
MNKYRAHPSILLFGKNSITAYAQRLPPPSRKVAANAGPYAALSMLDRRVDSVVGKVL